MAPNGLLTALFNTDHNTNDAMPKAKEYTKTPTIRRLKAAAGGVVEAEDNTEKKKAVQVNKLFRCRVPRCRVEPTAARTDFNIGTIGVSSLEDVLALMESYKSFNDLLKATNLKSRQSIHSNIRNATEALSRAKVEGVPVTRQLQHIINNINSSDDPLAQLMRFFIQLAPLAERRTMASLASIYFNIPLDQLVILKDK